MALSSNPGSRRKCRSAVMATTVRLISMTTSIGSHLGSLGKCGQDPGKPRDYLAGQRLVVDIALQRPCPQDLARTTQPLRGQFKEPLAQGPIELKPTNGDVETFLKIVLDFRIQLKALDREVLLERLHPGAEPFRLGMLLFTKD